MKIKQAQRGARIPRPAHGHGPQQRASFSSTRTGTERGGTPHALRRASAGRRRRQGQARRAARRVGSLYPSRSSPRSRAPSTSRTWSKAYRFGAARRVDRHHQQRHHRLARIPRGVDLRRAMVIKDKKGKIGKLSRGGEARYLLPVDAILVGRARPRGEGGDVLARIPTRERQDARHHRRPAARGRAVRGAQAQGPRHHRRDRRHGAARHATTRTSGASPSFRPRRAARAGRVSDPQGQAHLAVQEGDIVERASSCSTAIPRRTTSWRSRASRSSPTTSSTRSRRSTGCRASHQRQAHRGDRPADAAEDRGRRVRATPSSSRASRSTASTSRRPTQRL